MNKVFAIAYSPEAMEDLKSIYSYIAYDLKSPDAAKSQLNRIRKAVRSLDYMPLRYSTVDWEPWQSLGIHKIPVGRFLVFYAVNDTKLSVVVIRIVYEGRNLEFILGNEDG